jgi:protein-tyrosine kinase
MLCIHRGGEMSRIFHALEKAEKEKQEKKREVVPLQIFEERIPPRKEESIVKPREGKAEEWRLPSREETPVLMAPTHSFSGEQFRQLKAQIFFRLSNPPHIILITSAVPGEGKTLVAVNLATAISKETHRKAILIDGDLRKPSIRLGAQNHSKGLSNYLSGETTLSEILLNSDVENLRVIPAGPVSKRTPELMDSKGLERLFHSLREAGDSTYMVIDSSPILASAEPALLSRMVDGVILVVRAGRTPKASIERAVKSIDGKKILGVVFNQMDLKPASYYSQYEYGYPRR